MISRTGRWLALLLPGVAWTSWTCARLPERTLGALAHDTLADSMSVPSVWGHLVSVTVNPEFPQVSTLWFADSTGNVRTVILDNNGRTLRRVASLITRK